VVINPEALWRLVETLRLIDWGAMAVDECHRFKHRTSQQTKTLLKLSPKIKRKYILSGSPHDNSPLELWSQFAILDPAILGSSFFAFRDRYAILGGYQGKQVLGYKNLDELQGKLRGHCQYVTTEECWDLPPRTEEVRRLDLAGDQATAYKAMARDLVAEVAGTEITATVLAAKLMKLRQLLAGFAYAADGSVHYLKHNAKLLAFGELLEDLPRDAKVIVWGVFHPELAAVERLLDERGIGHVRLDGTVPLAHRKSVVDRFQTDSGCRVFIGQAQAGGLGLDLSAAAHTVFLTNELDRSVRLQAEARPVGPHQKAARVTYYDFLCRGTWDVTAHRRLTSKAEVSERLTERAVADLVYGA
jgi:SNF2 family DNA or RNA helicase